MSDSVADILGNLLLDAADVAEATASPWIVAHRLCESAKTAIAQHDGVDQNEIVAGCVAWLRARKAESVLLLQARDLIAAAAQAILLDEIERLTLDKQFWR